MKKMNSMTPANLYAYAYKVAKRSEARGEGTQYPTFRQVAKRFKVKYDDIEDAVSDGQGRNDCGEYFGVGIGVAISGCGYRQHDTRGEYEVEAY